MLYYINTIRLLYCIHILDNLANMNLFLLLYSQMISLFACFLIVVVRDMTAGRTVLWLGIHQPLLDMQYWG